MFTAKDASSVISSIPITFNIKGYRHSLSLLVPTIFFPFPPVKLTISFSSEQKKKKSIRSHYGQKSHAYLMQRRAATLIVPRRTAFQ